MPEAVVFYIGLKKLFKSLWQSAHKLTKIACFLKKQSEIGNLAGHFIQSIGYKEVEEKHETYFIIITIVVNKSHSTRK